MIPLAAASLVRRGLVARWLLRVPPRSGMFLLFLMHSVSLLLVHSVGGGGRTRLGFRTRLDRRSFCGSRMIAVRTP